MSQPYNLALDPVFAGSVRLPGVELFVREYGTAGPRLIIVHGGPDWDHSYFLPFVLPLAAHLRVTLFDLRGCGRSQKFHDPSRYDLDVATDDLAALIAHVAGAPALVLGFSYGGRIALRLAERYPEVVDGLILASTTAYDDFGDELEQWDERRQRADEPMQVALSSLLDASDVAAEIKTREMARLTAPLDVYDLSLLPLIHEVQDRITFSGEWMTAWRAGLLGSLSHREYGPYLAQLGVPILILHGEKDMRFPASVAHRLYAHLKDTGNARLVILPRVGHLAHVEATSDWTDAVLRFVVEMTSTGTAR